MNTALQTLAVQEGNGPTAGSSEFPPPRSPAMLEATGDTQVLLGKPDWLLSEYK